MAEDLWSFVNEALDRHKQRTAWIKRGGKGQRQSYTYQQVRDFSLNLAAGLRQMGVVQGDRVGVLSPNGPEWGVAALAIWKLGAIVAPLHIGNSDEELAQQARVLDPKVILYHGKDRSLPKTRSIELEQDGDEQEARFEVPARAHDEAVRIYTSGSTGKPKMVRLSHRNIISNVRGAMQLDVQVAPSDRFLSLLPLSHAMELTGGMLLPLCSGSTIVLPRTLAAGEILDALKTEGITVVIGVPRLFRNVMLGLRKRFQEGGPLLRAYLALLRRMPARWRRALNQPIRRNLGGRIKCWLSGGSRLDPEIAQFFRDIGVPLRQGYGLTECSPVVSVQDDLDPVIDSVGRPFPDMEVKIAEPDATGTGELWVRGPNVMLGYVDEAQTREVMQDGWYNTGDIGRLLDGDKIVLTGRSKRLIVTEAGKNVYPEELETMLERHADLKEAGVVEVDMSPAAVLAIEPPDQIGKAKRIIKDFNARVSSHNRITRYAVVDELPRTPLGKVALKDLPAIFERNETDTDPRSRG